MMMWNDGYQMGWPMWLFMILGLIGWWALVVVLVRQALGDRRHALLSAAPSALAELDGRFARGEISAEDYTTARRLISDGH